MSHKINGLSVMGFRGIKKVNGDLVNGFKGVNVFIGKNNSGKSSLLEALYIASCRCMLDILDRNCIAYIVKRRGWFGLASLKHLIYAGMSKAKVKTQGIEEADIELSIGRNFVKCTINEREKFEIGFSLEGEAGYSIHNKFNVIFLDWNLVRGFGDPESIYSLALRMGGVKAKEGMINVLKSAYKELRGFEPLLLEPNKWVLHAIMSDLSIPFYVLGDGLRLAFTHLALLSAINNGIVLIEEPELHQHALSLELIAKAIVESAIDRKNQVFISTHSLELIDLLLDEAEELKAQEELAIFKVDLKNGALSYRRYEFDEALKARRNLEVDLRG